MILLSVYHHTVVGQLLQEPNHNHRQNAGRITWIHRFLAGAIMVVYARIVRCDGDMPRCTVCQLDVLETTCEEDLDTT